MFFAPCSITFLGASIAPVISLTAFAHGTSTFAPTYRDLVLALHRSLL